jgi:hypothetical protein
VTGLGCRMCGDMTHWQQLCPWNNPAADLAEHQFRIRTYIDRMVANDISVAMKREFVKGEYEMWNARRKGKAA